jgi:hypothetical protein
MTEEEAVWCVSEINKRIPGYPVAVVEYRAAQVWKGSQVRRFKKMRDSFPSYYYKEWIAYRWNISKLRFDKYVLGYNWEYD